MNRYLLLLLSVLFAYLSMSADNLDDKIFYIYNTTRAGDGNALASGTRLYWRANADVAYLTDSRTDDDMNMLWKFVQTDGGVYIYSVGQGRFLSAIQGGGYNVTLNTTGAVYTMNAGSGTYEGAFSFNSGPKTANYLFADNPAEGSTQFRLDGWSNMQHEYFRLEEYVNPGLENYCAVTPFDNMGTAANVGNIFTATPAAGYEFDYWSDGHDTYSDAIFTYTGLTPVRMTAFFRKQRDKSKPLPPTMGWSSWNTYHAQISGDNIKSQADALIETGLYDKGYIYVNIDDGFQKNRDADGNLLTDGTRFPDGLQPVVDYIHTRGLKAGTYTDAGSNTCASMYAGESGGTGSGIYEHEEGDCDLFFNRNRFDFIKVDYCGAGDQNLNVQHRYTSIRNYLDKTGRDIQYNLCRWAYPGTWSADVSDSWRTTGDIWSYWSKDNGASYSVKSIIKENLYLSAYSMPGHYNDMDMLEVGVNRDGGKLSEQESKTHFGMWCIMNSPLLIGCDVNSISESDLNILGNEELIAVNQDPVFQQAYVVGNDNGAYTLVRDLIEPNGLVRAVALYNPTDESRSMTLSFDDIDLAGPCYIRNLTDRMDVGSFDDVFTAQIPAHGAIIYKVTGTERKIRKVYEAETAFCTAYNEIAEAVGAVITENTNCSGGIVMGWLGKTKQDAFGKTVSNDLIWKNVYVPGDCTVQIEISFISGEDRIANLMVNGQYAEALKCNAGNWSSVGKVYATIDLKAGNNEIRLYNDDAYMPDIDVMKFTSVVPTGISSVRETQSDNIHQYDLSGREAQDNHRGILIKNGVKVIK